MDDLVRTPDISHFDPFGKPFRDDPKAFYATLIEASPGFSMVEEVPSAYVARHAHVAAVLKDPVRFSSVKPKGLPGMEKVDFFNGLPVMNYSDDPTHARLRRVVAAAFLPKRAKEMSEAAAQILDGLLAKLEGKQGSDIMADVMRPFSTKLLLGHFLGVPEADWPIFLNYLKSLPLLEHVRPGQPKPQAYLDAWAEGVRYCTAAIERARLGNTADLIGLIVSAHDSGSTLSDDEMMAMLVVLFIGGVTTVAGTVGSAVLNLALYPALAERIRQTPSLAGPLFEESLRMDPTVLLVMRFATEDVELGGKTIQKGMPVYTLISAACHDGEVFPGPEELNVDRKNLAEHFGFGRGIHACIGNSITRAVAPLVINAFAQRYPKLRVGDPGGIVYYSVPRSRHLAAAPLLFS